MYKPLTVSQAIKECRKAARDNGLTFKRSNLTINGHPAYHYEGRFTGRVYRKNLLINTAFEIACSDELKLYREN